MFKKISVLFLCSFLLSSVNLSAAPTPIMPVIRNSVFSTSTDWESISGLRLTQFSVDFVYDKDLVKNGLELYFLDGFPCFGQTDSTRAWVGINSTDKTIRMTCLFAPEIVNFAWRNAARDSTQDKTTGLLECPITGTNKLTIKLSDCTVGKNWEEYR